MSGGDTIFTVRFWGVTGSFANPLPPPALEQKLVDVVSQLWQLDEFRARGAELIERPAELKHFITTHVPFASRSTYGGNTTCIEIQTPDALIIIDAGSGMRRLGEELNRRRKLTDGPREAHVLITHAHMDHTFATPFVDPYYDANWDIHVWGSLKVLRSLHVVLSPNSKLRSMYFPPTYELLEGIKQFTTIRGGEGFDIGCTRVSCHELNHPGGAFAFRLDAHGKSLVIATDHEHADGADLQLARFASGTDLLYIDAQYLDAEYHGRASIDDEKPASRRGWGHSTVEAAVATAVSAQAKSVLLGHHDPKRNDTQLAQLESYARQLLHNALAAAQRDRSSCELGVAYEQQLVLIG